MTGSSPPWPEERGCQSRRGCFQGLSSASQFSADLSSRSSSDLTEKTVGLQEILLDVHHIHVMFCFPRQVRFDY